MPEQRCLLIARVPGDRHPLEELQSGETRHRTVDVAGGEAQGQHALRNVELLAEQFVPL
ncbi:hypothetical protein SDC9_137556 [bioreactor metagenome]|uniref:Uncharacterized protein n=1 Tax=bioreactor metagenome TaxID=1076179 RepID=A0A645DMG0_9ZZZZ